MPANQLPGRLLLATLLVLTVVSGLVDAVSYLGLGHVFTANMTGNVVLLGFAAAGASGFSAPACLTSLGTFLVGAAAAGRIARRLGSRRRLLAVAMATEAVVTGAAAIIAAVVSEASEGWPRFTIIALLAFGMGVRNSTIRRLAVPDLTTTVLTTPPAAPPRWWRCWRGGSRAPLPSCMPEWQRRWRSARSWCWRPVPHSGPPMSRAALTSPVSTTSRCP